MKKISDNKIQQVIRESINELLLEYGGVSNEILTMSQDILSAIAEKAQDSYWLQSSTDNQYFKIFEFKVPNDGVLKDYVVYAKLYAYVPSQHTFREALDRLNEMGMLYMGFSPSKKSIIMRIPYPSNGQLDEYGKHYILSSLNHEVKHAYQNAKRNHTNITQAYQKSLNGKDWNEEEVISLQRLRYWNKKCYYLLDLDEIDARLQEIYIDLTNFKDLKQSEANERIQKAVESYGWIKNQVIFPTDEFRKEFYQEIRNNFPKILQQELGNEITPKMFFNYCERGIQRYQQRLRRILGRFHEEQGITNGSFKQYSQNEIPQGEIFRKKPSLWQKLFNRFKK